MSKDFETIIYSQIDAFTQCKLSNLSTGFIENHGTHHFLMFMLKIWKNKGGFVCAIFMALSMGFHTIPLDLMIAKLGAYSFSQDSPEFIIDNREPRVYYYRSSSRLNSRTIIIQHLHQRYFSFCFKFTFKQLCQWQHLICLWLLDMPLEEIKNILHFNFDLV